MTKSILTVSSSRWIFTAIGVSCLALLGAAYFLQYGPGQLQPCPLCILQRYVYMAIAVVALAAAAICHDRLFAMVAAVVLDVFAAIGAGLALWQVTKGDTMTSCDTDLVGQIVYALPMRAWWPEFLAAYGGCADKVPPIFGISVPVWSLLWFAGFSVICGFVLIRLRRVGNTR
ncbi:MAG: disulfide bond formation protein B [Burkholderiales bacterium]|nr:disulfide bond formation protein B [Burkholderiales bacterium]